MPFKFSVKTGNTRFYICGGLMGIQAFRYIAKQRSYLVGELTKLERLAAANQRRVSELKLQIVAFNAALQAQGIDIDPDFYAPIVRSRLKTKYFAYGEVLVMCLGNR